MKLDAATVARQYAKCGLRMPEPPAKKLPRQKIDGVYRSKLERDFARTLATWMAVGEIEGFWYEPWTFKLGKRRSYTPDFLVEYPNGVRRWFEVKGYLWAKDAIRLDWFVREYPGEVLKVVTREKGTWCFKQVNE